jgi:hypothetical protein
MLLRQLVTGVRFRQLKDGTGHQKVLGRIRGWDFEPHPQGQRTGEGLTAELTTTGTDFVNNTCIMRPA